MNKKYLPNKTGYLVVHREIQQLLQEKGINFSTLGAYICFVCDADWDKRHKNYRAILPNDKELSVLWSCHPSTVYRQRMSLIQSGLLEEIDHITYVKNLEIFEIGVVKAITKSRLANSHKYFAKTEKEFAKALFGIAKKQSTEADIRESL